MTKACSEAAPKVNGSLGGSLPRRRHKRSRIKSVASTATSVMVLLSQLRGASPQGAGGVYDIFGEIATEKAAYQAEAVQGTYLCFAGYLGGAFDSGSQCKHRSQHDYIDNDGNPTSENTGIANPRLIGKTGFHDDLEPDNPSWSAGLNDVRQAICLQCCSNSGCEDDDFDDETGICADQGYNDKWRIECDIDRTDYRAASRTGFKNHQMRFLRNNDDDDTFVTHCMIPRWGYTYHHCDPALMDTESEGSPRCPRTLDYDPEAITCDGTNEYSGCTDDENPRCWCTIPEGYYHHAGGTDNTKYFVGYDLALWVRDETNVEGEFWRSVQKCEVTGNEWSIKSIDNWDRGSGEVYFRQHIHIMTWHGYDHFAEEHVALTVLWISIAIVSCVCLVSCVRGSYCVVCQKRLIVSWVIPSRICHERCLWCIFYGAEPPDPSLLNVLRSRQEHLRGKPFRDFLLTGVTNGRNKIVGLEMKKKPGQWFRRPNVRKVYVAPKVKEIDSPFALKKPPPRQKPGAPASQNW